MSCPIWFKQSNDFHELFDCCSYFQEPEIDPQHFEVRWELRCSFDRAMKELRASFLRIEELTFHPHATKQRKTEVQETLRGFGYMI